MLAKSPKSTEPLDIDAIKSDLAAAQEKLTTVAGSELSAYRARAAFNTWRSERDGAISEVDRLTRLAKRLEADAADKAAREHQAAWQKRVDDQRATNKKLADRIKTEGGAAVATLLDIHPRRCGGGGR